MAKNPFKQLDVIRKISIEGKKVKDCYRLMYNKELWIKAYAKLAPKPGNLTKGTTNETIDGFNYKTIDDLINKLKQGTFRFSPVRRTYIPKSNGNLRPLGIANFKEKLVQEVMKMILDNIYEPVFSNNSYGFRINRSCHTALSEIKNTWTGMTWCIEGDIKGYFDNIDHQILLSLLEKKIDDRRFILLIHNSLKCGIMENWKFHKTYSGTAQGSQIFPIFANIYLHEFDKFMEKQIEDFNEGKRRRNNPEYQKQKSIIANIAKKLIKEESGDNCISKKDLLIELKSEKKKLYKIPSKNPMDHNCKRMRYVRYVDDFVVGIIGSKEEAKQLKGKIKKFLDINLKLELSEEKTLISNLKNKISFLGYQFSFWKQVNGPVVKRVRYNNNSNKLVKKRTLTKQIELEIPIEKISKYITKNGYGNLFPFSSKHRTYLLKNSELEIMKTYNAELRGFTNYYKLADNYYSLDKLFFIAEGSFLKTLAIKNNSTMMKEFFKMRKYQQKRLCIQYKNRKGENILVKLVRLKDIKRSKGHKFNPKYEENIDLIPNILKYSSNTELEKRLAINKCEACGSVEGLMEVHHIKKLKNLHKKKNLDFFNKIMIARNRKTLVLCQNCHSTHHKLKIPINQLASRIH